MTQTPRLDHSHEHRSSEHFSAALSQKSLLRRVIDVSTPDGLFIVEYSGWGLGYETVRVNGQAMVRKLSVRWFEPRLEFYLGRWVAVLEISVSWYLTFRAFRLSVDDQLVYVDGETGPGLCVHCSYDLRGSHSRARCPECGKPFVAV